MPANTISVSRLAKLCDLTTRQIRNLTNAGVLHRATDEEGNELRGRYSELSVRDYIRYVRKGARLDDTSESEHTALKIRKTRAEAEIAEQRARQFKGQLYHGADIEFAITNMLTYIKQGMLAIPAGISRKLIGKKKFKEIYEPLMNEIVGVLERLSVPDRETFMQLSASRLAAQGVNLAGANGKENHQAKT
jgi:phage terminase Nu1 subunit (DNA packaging protein)